MLKSYLSAVAFLTILPVPARFCDADGFARCARFFPLAGLLLGAVVAAGGALAFALWPPLLAATLAVLLLAVLSGGLHLDGLADTVDGFASARSRERILEIMKDSRIGAMGALALISILALKVLALSCLMAESFRVALLLAPVAGRVSILLVRELVPPARQDGLGATAGGEVGRGLAAVWALLLLAAGGVLMGGRGVMAGLACLLAAAGLAWQAKRKIGGFTGDVLGASCELAETAFLLVLSARVGA